ncbi:related to Zinc finger protein GIS2 [Armillaria ostoyae]|uniref:Related to Zinc finger protein GIS2 n=1 Tax=Armillaria ostoyae TaxID=47428 RepID=A0A284R047_ARMOS|nr:related to Zinc finger protein GIS2 [Armillaria ostoyae]
MAFQYSRKGCFKCGNLGHIAENCSSEQRLCYNCRQPGHESSACPSPRTVSAKQCYSCGGVGHIQAECPSLRIQQQGSNQKCYNCGRFGHIARACPNGANGMGGFASRAPPPGRALNTATLPPVKCYRDCLATPGSLGETASVANKNKTCYKCQQEGHIARDCPETETFVA